MGSVTIPDGASVYLDANILIYSLEDIEGLGARLVPLMGRIDRREVEAFTSELSLAEALVQPIAENNAATRAGYEKMFAPTSPLRASPIDRGVLVSAATLRVRYNLKLPDAIHVATALGLPCDFCSRTTAGCFA
jgi:predicted nucleic acid-binding protein